MYDWLVNATKPVRNVGTWWRATETKCVVCGNADHSGLDCPHLDDDTHIHGRKRSYAPQGFWCRQMDNFKPSKRGTAVGGVNDGPYMPPHMQPGAKGTDAFVPGGTAGIQNNQIPKTYDEISNTPLQTRSALPGQMNQVTLDQLDCHGRLKQPSPEHLTVNGGPDTAHIWKGRYVGEIVECLSGPVRTDDNGGERPRRGFEQRGEASARRSLLLLLQPTST
eukprot:SAG25_NODE_68_length_17436_cov_79.923055_7_plen_221_part_00